MWYFLYEYFGECLASTGFWVCSTVMLLVILYYEKKLEKVSPTPIPTPTPTPPPPLTYADIVSRLGKKKITSWDRKDSKWWKSKNKKKFTFVAGSRKRGGAFAVRRNTDKKVFVVG